MALGEDYNILVMSRTSIARLVGRWNWWPSRLVGAR
jgi:hypothetical protein